MLHLPETDLKKTRFYQEVFGEGRQEGVADILLRLITVKFGPPDQAICRRLETADTDTLLRWSERILNAGSLDEIIGDPSPSASLTTGPRRRRTAR